MLVLTGKRDESLIIDGTIAVTVLITDGGRVRLGITAPRHVGVRRAELALLDPPVKDELVEMAQRAGSP
jgi:carbon storage regulator